jgi:hypothetical protein
MTDTTHDAGAKMQVEAGLKTLCEWTAGLRFSDIPPRALSQAVLILGDNIAAALSAGDEPELRAYHEQLIASRTAQQATLFCRGAPQVALIEAAVGNGLAITWNELDDGYTRTAVHPGALSQPLILAAAEAGNLSMAETLRATIGAYEIGTRFARAWPGTPAPAWGLQRCVFRRRPGTAARRRQGGIVARVDGCRDHGLARPLQPPDRRRAGAQRLARRRGVARHVRLRHGTFRHCRHAGRPLRRLHPRLWGTRQTH